MRYYTILTKEELDAPIKTHFENKVGVEQTAIILEMIKYSELETLNELLVKDCCLSARELEDGRFVCSINLANPAYLPNKCAIKNIDDEQLDLAKTMYGEGNILDQDQIKTLNYKTWE